MSYESHPSSRDNPYAEHLYYGPQSLDFEIKDIDKLLAKLTRSNEPKWSDRDESPQMIYSESDPTILPHPIAEAMITYNANTEQNNMLDGVIWFDYQELEDAPGSRRALISTLVEQLTKQNYEIVQAPHQEMTLRALHQADAEVYSGCDSTVFKIDEDDFGYNLRVQLEPDLPTQTTLTQLRLETYLHHWKIAFKAVETLERTKRALSLRYPNIPVRSLGQLALERSHMPPAREMFDETQAPLRFNDIGGAFEAKEALRENAMMFKHPEYARQYDIHPSSFVLYGPPGTGKSSLSEAFANEIGASVTSVSSAEIVDKWVGDSGKNVAELFKYAKEHSEPHVIIIDEFDSLGNNQVSNAERTDVKNMLKREISDIALHHPHIIIAATTNKFPDELDPALVRAGRLQPIELRLPNEQERREIWSTILYQSSTRHDPYRNGTIRAADLEYPLENESSYFSIYDIDSLNLDELVAQSSDYTGADIKAVLEQARRLKLKQALIHDSLLPVTQGDIIAAIRSYKLP